MCDLRQTITITTELAYNYFSLCYTVQYTNCYPTRTSTWHHLLSATRRHDLTLSRRSQCISDCNFIVRQLLKDS